MKITAFNPMIGAKDPEAIISLFEELGFELSHKKDELDGKGISFTRMKDANGFHVDIAHSSASPLPHDMTLIRMNVDDFDEACNILLEHGFKNMLGNRVVDTGSSQDTLMASPSGFSIHLCKHTPSS